MHFRHPVAKDAVRSKAAVLLLLIHFYCCSHCFFWVLCSVLVLLSSTLCALLVDGDEGAGCLCADPEIFIRGGSTLTTFFIIILFFRGGTIQIPLSEGRHWHTCETPFKWHFAGVPMMAQH